MGGARGLVALLLLLCACKPSGRDPDQGLPDLGPDLVQRGDGSRITPSRLCDAYLTCLSAAEPLSFPGALQIYQADGPCWKSNAAATACQTACQQALAQLSKKYAAPECKPPPIVADAALPIYDWRAFPPPPPMDALDILFLVDNSNSMEEEQRNLSQQFPLMIQALRSPKLGQANPAGPPCTATDTSNCRIPNVHIGVISSDLGAGKHSFQSCEVPGGDGGRMKNTPGKLAPPGCPTPTDPWISYTNGVANVSSGSLDPILKVQESFACLAQLGTGGCGFEHQLEAVRLALTPPNNSGFLRANSMLVVVIITDEDDCSALNGDDLFDPSEQGLSAPFGPLTSFRCFEFGFSCAEPIRPPGPKSHCVPSQPYLHPVNGYINFFKSLRPPSRLLVAAIAGPTSPVEVGLDGTNPALKASCNSTMGQAAPGLRLKAVIDGLGTSGVYNKGLIGGTQLTEVNICASDFGPALKYIAEKINAAL